MRIRVCIESFSSPDGQFHAGFSEPGRLVPLRETWKQWRAVGDSNPAVQGPGQTNDCNTHTAVYYLIGSFEVAMFIHCELKKRGRDRSVGRSVRRPGGRGRTTGRPDCCTPRHAMSLGFADGWDSAGRVSCQRTQADQLEAFASPAFDLELISTPR
jgi:hypothetical protein